MPFRTRSWPIAYIILQRSDTLDDGAFGRLIVRDVTAGQAAAAAREAGACTVRGHARSFAHRHFDGTVRARLAGGGGGQRFIHGGVRYS